jgi:hypothetical protein
MVERGRLVKSRPARAARPGASPLDSTHVASVQCAGGAGRSWCRQEVATMTTPMAVFALAVLVLAGCRTASPDRGAPASAPTTPLPAGPAHHVEMRGRVVDTLPDGRLAIETARGLLEVPVGRGTALAPGSEVEVAVAVQRLQLAPGDVTGAAPAALPRALTADPPAAFATAIGRVVATGQARMVVDAAGRLTLPVPADGCCAPGDLVQVWTHVRPPS